MTRSPALVRAGSRTGLWLLPWIGVLVVSATLAYALDSALDGGQRVSSRPSDMQFAVPTGKAAQDPARDCPSEALAAAPADLGLGLTPEPCAASSGAVMYVGVDSWIVAESRRMGFEHVTWRE